MSRKLARQVIKDLYHPLPHNVLFVEGRLDGVSFKPSIEWSVESVMTAADEVAMVETARMGRNGFTCRRILVRHIRHPQR